MHANTEQSSLNGVDGKVRFHHEEHLSRSCLFKGFIAYLIPIRYAVVNSSHALALVCRLYEASKWHCLYYVIFVYIYPLKYQRSPNVTVWRWVWGLRIYTHIQSHTYSFILSNEVTLRSLQYFFLFIRLCPSLQLNRDKSFHVNWQEAYDASAGSTFGGNIDMYNQI